MSKDKNCKLDTTENLNDYLTILSFVVINENDVSRLINLCKNHLQQLHEVVTIDLPKINTETKQTINAMIRINPEEYPDAPNAETMRLSMAHFNVGSVNNNQITSDRNDVANMIFSMNLFNLNDSFEQEVE